MSNEHKCPRCGKNTVVKENMFFWEGTSLEGRVCEPCNVLYVYEKEPTIFDLAKESSSREPLFDYVKGGKL